MIKKIITVFSFILLVASPVMVVVSPQPVAAACDDRILGIPPWYRGLVNANCSVKGPNELGGISNYVWKIALNIIEIALIIVGYVAVFFILYGGFQFLTGGASPDKVVKARKTILNAVIGLTISMASVAIVNLVFGVIG